MERLLNQEFASLLPQNAIRATSNNAVLIRTEEDEEYMVQQGWVSMNQKTGIKQQWESIDAFLNAVSPKFRQRWAQKVMEKLGELADS